VVTQKICSRPFTGHGFFYFISADAKAIFLYRYMVQIQYSKFPCAGHSDEPQKTDIVFASGLHDVLSFISIAQKETFHIGFVPITTISENIALASEA
jgi:phosphoribulokinase